MPIRVADRARPTRVLVVDDEPSIRALAERALRDAGYAIDFASSGQEALSIVEREGSFDLFVIDVMMPGMRGDELARQLRLRVPDVKLLYFTGCADSLFREKNALWGNEAFLEKPVSVDGLREAISLLLFAHLRGPDQNPAVPGRTPLKPGVVSRIVTNGEADDD